MKPLVQKPDTLDLQVLKEDGETLATLSYPRETRVWQVLQDVKQQLTESRCMSPEQLTFRSSRGIVLQPHNHLYKVLNASCGDYIVAEFEPSDIKLKNSAGYQTSERKMKQGRFDKPSPRDPIRERGLKPERDRPVTRGSSFPEQGKARWGSFKIPLRNHPYSRQQPNMQNINRESTSLNCTATQQQQQQTNHRTQRDRRERNGVSGNSAETHQQQPNHRTRRDRGERHDSDNSSQSVKTRAMQSSEGRVDRSDRTVGVTARSSSGSDQEKLLKKSTSNNQDDVDSLQKNLSVEQRSVNTRRGNRDAKEAQRNREQSVKKTSAVETKRTSIEEVAADSALGSLMKNYTDEDDDDDDDDDDEEQEEDGDMEIQDSCGSTWKVTESAKRTKRDDKNNATSTSKWKTNSKTSTKEDQKSSEPKDSDMNTSAFTLGVGAFLQALKSESEKPQQCPPTRTPDSTSSFKKFSSSESSKDWSKKPLRTYSRQRLQEQDKSWFSPTSIVNHTEDDIRKKEDTPSSSVDDVDSSSRTDRYQEEKLETTNNRIPPVTYPPVSSRTRSSGSSRGNTEENNTEVVKDNDDEEEDVWQMDVVLLSIKCKGPLSNKQLAACINGILLDLEAQDTAALESVTVDEVQKKLESIYQRDLSDRKTVIEYVFKKLQRDGPKRQASSPVVVTIGQISITKTDMYTLAENMWLNDNIINSYLHLLTEASKRKVFAFTTFFYSNLTRKTKGYDGVKGWTDHIDLFSQDLVLVPVHIRNHWTLAAIHVQQHRIEYYNSLGSNNPKCFGVLIEYLRKEATAKKRDLFTALSWGTGFMRGTPQQKNMSDCGVYVCQYAKRLCLGKPVKFTTMEAINFRKEMVHEIIEAKINVS